MWGSSFRDCENDLFRKARKIATRPKLRTVFAKKDGVRIGERGIRLRIIRGAPWGNNPTNPWPRMVYREGATSSRFRAHQERSWPFHAGAEGRHNTRKIRRRRYRPSIIIDLRAPSGGIAQLPMWAEQGEIRKIRRISDNRLRIRPRSDLARNRNISRPRVSMPLTAPTD